MKRGRPSKRREITGEILYILKEHGLPMTVSSLCSAIWKRTGTRPSWNTVQKYLHEMVETNKINPIVLSHSKERGKDGLVVYTLK